MKAVSTASKFLESPLLAPAQGQVYTPSRVAKILLIEDQQEVRESLQQMLDIEGHRVQGASSAEEGFNWLQRKRFDLVVTDYQLPGLDGFEVVKTVCQSDPQLPVILMTAYHSTDRVIDATQLGAYDYITKPIDPPEFLEKVKQAVASRTLSTGESASAAAVATDPLADGKYTIIGASRPMVEVFKEIGRVAGRPLTVLVRGETGTGKELVARVLHRKSERAAEPFVAVNCAAIPENLLESEFFGHEPGAFTDAKLRHIGKFEQANKGTIFLDEIGDMSNHLQQKFLRVLQERVIQRVGGKDDIPIDVRVIAATHHHLESAIQQKLFRLDLYYRLNEAVVNLPPLRERREDIVLLTTYFVQKYSQALGSINPVITDDALKYLREQWWPGNVRELENVIRRALVLAGRFSISRTIIEKAHSQSRVIEETIQKYKQVDPERPFAGEVAELLARAKRDEAQDVQAVLMDNLERELYDQAIQLANGDQSKAARWLGVSRPTMREKLQRYGLHPKGDGTTEAA
jgi:DNA-binding NtrC family response regulator